jgi:protein SCO1/2
MRPAPVPRHPGLHHRLDNVTATADSNKPAGTGLWLVIAGALALIAGILAAVYLSAPKTLTIQSGTLLQQPRALPEFSLIDQDGAAFTREQLLGHWTLIFPGFTYCPDVCPTTLAMLKNVESQLGPRAEQLRVAMFSIDPERYVSHFSPRFQGVTVAEPGLRSMAQTLGVAYIKVPGDTADSYTMDHSAALILINPRAELAGYFTTPLQAPALLADLKQIIDRTP